MPCDNRRSSAGRRRNQTPRWPRTGGRARRRRAATDALRRERVQSPGRECDRGTYADRERSCGLLVRRSPLKDKAPVAIAAFDEAGIRFDPEIDARMAERGRNLARTIARDLHGLYSDDFGRRDLRRHMRHLGGAPLAYKRLVVVGGD